MAKYDAESTVASQPLSEKSKEIRQRQDIDEETRQKLLDEVYDEYHIPLREQSHLRTLKYFNENKNNALGIFLLWFGAQYSYFTPYQLDSLYAQAGDIVRKSKRLQRTMEINTKKMQTAEGMPFTDFTIENGNIDGSSVSLSDYVGKGKYVLVDFWASWCSPCLAEIPTLVEVYEKYKGDKFEILGIAVWEKREATMKYLERHGSQWPQIIDAANIPTTPYGIVGIPEIILFAPNGTIIARNLRGNRIKAKIAEVMANEN